VGAGGCDSLRLPDHLLANPAARFHDLGADYHATRINTERRTRNYVTQLMAMGYRVTLEPAA
jgi:transposase